MFPCGWCRRSHWLRRAFRSCSREARIFGREDLGEERGMKEEEEEEEEEEVEF